MTPFSSRLSVVIPVAPGDGMWRELLPPLSRNFPDAEILLVSPEPPPAIPGVSGSRWLRSEVGRARQLNHGARNARGEWLWFLHADSELGRDTGEAVERILAAGRRAVYYFDLRFRPDGPRAMAINTAGVYLRSRLLGMPFGDQAFLMPQSLWRALGGFPEVVRYGEDHGFVWAARRAGIPVRAAGASIATSARKYRERGWGRTTAGHLLATYRQAGQELGKSWRLRNRWRSGRSAIAIFVKTPGLSPIKTRLAATAGEPFASRFYGLSIAAMRALAQDLRTAGYEPYWAIAEPRGMDSPHWADQPRIDQGEGGLGKRLGRTYDRLLRRHRRVFFVGGDCPHLSVTDIREAEARLDRAAFVLGPARDGGFFLFAGRAPIESAAWETVAYSAADTLADLESVLRELGTVDRIGAKTDVDTADDLIALRRELDGQSEQRYSARHGDALAGIRSLLRPIVPA
jgi:glycosyltransferase A (GT-A) superfamily protein (DUF2064 family)